MKELSIEEKAKAYDEAIERANSLLSGNQLGNAWIYKLLPELREPDDERIRKEIKDFFSRIMLGQENFLREDYDWNAWIAWLEKQGDNRLMKALQEANKKIGELVEENYYLKEQGEQKPADKIEPIFNVGDKIQYSKGCGTIMTIEKIENGEYIFANNMGHTTIESGNQWHLVEQKPAWSEEDERSVKELLYLVEANYLSTEEPRDRLIDFLESLKYKVQPRQKWSKEDETMITDLSVIVHTYFSEISGIPFKYDLSEDKIRTWLKSLKDRVQSQHEWKQENIGDLTDFENAMMHIGGSFFGQHAGLDPNDTNAIKEQANVLLGLVSSKEWSEEDKEQLDFCCAAIEMSDFSNVDYRTQAVSWLNLLKDRVQPQPKQEWSEEDEFNISELCSLITESYSKEAASGLRQWLKSLKPQNRWKPSDEQMEVLLSEVKGWTKGCPKQIVLESLYQDLKKLTEEKL